MRVNFLLATLLVLLPQRAYAQTADCSVKIGGDVPNPKTLSQSDLMALPRQSVRVQEHEAPAVDYQGVLIANLLSQTGLPMGPALRGKALLQYIVVSAADGYRVVYALAEADSGFTDRVMLLADRKNGEPLDAHEGPCRLVMTGERRPARWARQVTGIEVHSAP